MNDTPKEIAAIVREKLMALSGYERMLMGAGSSEAACAMILASLPAGLSDIETKARLCERLYGNEVNVKAFVQSLLYRQERIVRDAVESMRSEQQRIVETFSETVRSQQEKIVKDHSLESIDPVKPTPPRED